MKIVGTIISAYIIMIKKKKLSCYLVKSLSIYNSITQVDLVNKKIST